MLRKYLFLATVGILAVSPAIAAPDRITRAVEPGRISALRGPRQPVAQPRADQGPVDPAMPISYATLYLQTAPGLEAFLAGQQNPSSPDYHRWLTPEQFGDRFGLSGNDIGKIVSWLQSEGLKVHDVARGRHWITFSSSAAQAGRAFGTTLHHYTVDGESHFANATDLSVPSAFEDVITGVDGLDDFVLQPLHRKAKLSDQPHLTSGAIHYLAPDDLATIYNVAPLYKAGLDGTGQKLVVIGRTDISLADIRAFRTRFNLPPNDPQVVLYGPDPGISQNDLGEADLDLEVSGAIARNATIIYVNSRSVNTSAQYAVDQNLAPVMTMSYGGCELTLSQVLRSVAQQANAQGITWMISSGDSGAATCDRSSPTPQAQKGNTVSYPASIPEVTAVGGTEFDEGTGAWWSSANTVNRASALSYVPERVWNDSVLRNSLDGGGGGASALYPKPVWQTGPGVPNDGARDLPDVSFTSSAAHDGYEIIYNGILYIFGGTSASSPLLAGVVALLNQSLAAANPNTPIGLGNINPALYRLAQASPDIFHDVTAGDNIVPCAQGSPDCVNGQAGYAAGPGYDLASGLGSIDVAKLIAGWNTGTSSTTTLSVNPSAIAVGDSVQMTATVAGIRAIPSGSVTFVANDVTLGTASLKAGSSSSTASLTVDGALIAGGNGTVGALYSGDGVYLASSGTAAVRLKLPVSGSYVLPAVTPNPVLQNGSTWPYMLRLSEMAGVATTLTVFTINGTNNLPAFSSTSIPPNGSLSASLAGAGLTVPLDRVFHFEGTDADGAVWKQELTVPFLGPATAALIPAISMTVSPLTVQQNPLADPSCQWSQRITVQELSGFAVSLSTLSLGGVSLTGSIPQLFGTTRLAPRGMLSATLCTGNITVPAQRTVSLTGVSEAGTGVSAAVSASFAAAPVAASAFSVSASTMMIPLADVSQTATAALDLKFSAGSPSWSVTVLPTTQTWMKVSSLSGIGGATLNLQARGTGLSNGVYNAILSIQASDAAPQSIQVPIAFVVGASSQTSIMGVGNAASGTQSFAPGQLMAVYGNNLAPSTQIAAIQPLPLTLAGVSATVNGVSAPLWFVGSGQMNIQIPYETSEGTAVLGVNNNGQVASFIFEVAPTAPGIFASQGSMVPFASGKPGQTLVGYITGDGDVTPTLPSGATPPSGTALSQFPQPRSALTMTIGGAQAKIVFKGIVTGLIGVTQVNFTVPPDATTGPQPVIVTVGGVSSAPVNLTITN